MNHPKVAIVILNWNRYEVSRRCIESLLQITYPRSEIVFVDNGSSDGSGARVKRDYPDLVYLQNDRNLGFARGCNVGIRVALTRGADYVLLLNNDITVERGFLEPLVETAESDESIGLVSGKMFLAQARDVLWYAGGSLSLLTGSNWTRGFGEKDYGQFDRTEEVGICTGAMMFIRRRVLETVGLLPEEYFFGQEEWDYSLTVQRRGFRLYYCPRSVVYHEADGSHYNLSPKYLYSGHRNRLIFQTKFLPKLLLGPWIFLYSTYIRHLTRYRLRLSAAELRAFQRSYEAALRDHRRAKRLYVEEEDLSSFEREYAAESGTVGSQA
jgi:GT2 family glycosyltransferase